MSKSICAILGIRYPILLGGMAVVGTAPLAAAVSEAGGLGILGAGTWSRDHLKDQIRRVRELTDRPFGANIPVSSPLAPEQIDAVIEERLPVVTTSAGGAGRYTARLKDGGIYVMHVVPTVGYAVQAETAGVDAVIAEGSESGGFTSIEEISTFVLVPQVVDAVSCPVLAAGGIGDGRGLAAALALGAVAVQVGTRFLAAAEAEIPDDYRQALIMAVDTDTMLHRSKHAALRLMKDDLRSRVHEFMAGAALQDPAKTPEDAGDWKAHLRDRPRGMPWAAGQVAGLIRDIRPAKEIIEDMVNQAGSVFRSNARTCEVWIAPRDRQ